jgi:branched-chain amino acid transport system ATP-binding protein
MLQVQNIETYYGPIRAIAGISLEIKQGKIICILGANGSGKSTILKTIAGVLEPDKGTISFSGRPITGLAPDRIAELGISFVPEGREIFPDLTVAESIMLGAYKRQDKKEIKNDIELCMHYFPVLKDRRYQTVGTMSGGEQQMLLVAMALMARPELLMVDEPSLGLAPIVTAQLFQIFQDINKNENTSILIVEQNAKLVLDIAEYGYVLENGRMVLEGTAGSLAEHPDVKEFYLGLKSQGVKGAKRWKRRKHW